MQFEVEYKIDGEIHSVKYTEMKDAGMAFAWCQHENPGANMIRATAYGRSQGEGRIVHLPPPVQRDPVKEPRPARALNKKEKGCEFIFYDQVKSEKA